MVRRTSREKALDNQDGAPSKNGQRRNPENGWSFHFQFGCKWLTQGRSVKRRRMSTCTLAAWRLKPPWRFDCFGAATRDDRQRSSLKIHARDVPRQRPTKFCDCAQLPFLAKRPTWGSVARERACVRMAFALLQSALRRVERVENPASQGRSTAHRSSPSC